MIREVPKPFDWVVADTLERNTDLLAQYHDLVVKAIDALEQLGKTIPGAEKFRAAGAIIAEAQETAHQAAEVLRAR